MDPQTARHTHSALPASSRKKGQLQTNRIAIGVQVERTLSQARDCRKETSQCFYGQMKPLVYIVTRWWYGGGVFAGCKPGPTGGEGVQRVVCSIFGSIHILCIINLYQQITRLPHATPEAVII